MSSSDLKGMTELATAARGQLEEVRERLDKARIIIEAIRAQANALGLQGTPEVPQASIHGVELDERRT